MKRAVCVIFLGCFSLTAMSQQPTWNQRFSAIRAVDSLLVEYELNHSFTDINNLDSISPDAMKSFRGLFASGATVYDDLCPSIFDGNYTNPMIFSEKTVDDFLSEVKKVYPRGLISVQITNINVRYDDLAERTVYVSIEKSVTANTAEVAPEILSGNRWNVRILDTVLITISITKDFKSALIEKISQDGSRGPDFRRTNDSDNDYVVNAIDRCKTVPGKLIFNGCEPPSGPLATLLLSGGPGYTISTFTQGDRNPHNLVYNVDEYKSEPRVLPHFSLSAEFEVFLGNKRHVGLGTGVMYSYLASNLYVNNYHVEYSSHYSLDSLDPGGHTFKKIITNSSDKVKENLNFSYLTIPIFLKYKTQFTSKLGLKINAGIGLSLPLEVGINPTDVQFNYEAIQAFNEDGSLGFSNEDHLSDLKYTVDAPGNGSPDSLLNYLLHPNGYDVGYHIGIPNATTKNFKIDPGGTFIFKPTLTYLLRSGAYLNFGLQFMYSYHRNSKFNADEYKLTDMVEVYNTLLAGTKDLNHIYIGLTFGISLTLIKGYPQTTF